MKRAQGAARSTDIDGLKKNLLVWIRRVYPEAADDKKFTAADLTVSKTDYSFQNEWTGLLLCPISMNWDDEKCVCSSYNNAFSMTIILSVKDKLRSNSNLAPTNIWPRFFYPRDTFDAADLWDGLLRSEILVLVSPYPR